ncbi:LSM domain-containing protein [Aspergillus undulatus]|uniref:LSM domain-containing protein n=1 Tax=Aspergillus undulatus TaxID=1810928 RepID=UPI003CCE253F
MDEDQAVRYLGSLIGKTLRVHATDGRVFVGVFKCTDAARNIILANTHEYRYPTTAAVRDAALKVEEAAASTSESQTQSLVEETQNLKLNMTSRFIGLVVVPGQHITSIELEEKPWEKDT